MLRPALGPTHPPIQWVSGALSLGVKQTEREANHSPPSGTEFKNEWSCTFTFPYVFMVWCLKHSLPNTSNIILVISCCCQCQTHPLTFWCWCTRSCSYLLEMSLKCSQTVTDDGGSFAVSIYVFTSDILSQNNFLLVCKHVVASCV
jgi:hypothetical protein